MHAQLITNFDSGNQAFIRAEQRKLAKLLYEARRRCGPNAKGSDRWNYRDIKYELPDPGIAARLLLEKLGPIPPGHSLDQ
jgi:hypothetical protein